MEDLIKAFSSESVVFLILGFPVLISISMVWFIGRNLEKLSKRMDKFSKVILLFILSHNGERQKAKEIATKMIKDGEDTIEEEIANL